MPCVCASRLDSWPGHVLGLEIGARGDVTVDDGMHGRGLEARGVYGGDKFWGLTHPRLGR